ncbi:unnamed protein product [Hydatigera taeniaeformis]|uniref:RRM domain-containing protein n=1 Tax=Hydatigena taeniaeformis TaxID=6205 RepID=A0A0R3X740_HYDTA|nr:unnamed protein product [Hydatigera taeniaeformis]
MQPEDPAGLSNSSSSSSDSEEIEAEALEAEVSALTQQLERNPYFYDAHVRRISLLRKAGELDRLRGAREIMSKYFPLTPKMWLQWTEDEASLVTEGGDREPVYQLFKRALADYQSVDVWLEYCEYAIGGIGTGETAELDRIRGVLEEAVANQGLNFAHGTLLFEVYREFETICLAQLQAKKDPVAVANQLKRIEGLFRRQLSIPHADMNRTMEEYKTFLEEMAEGSDGGLTDDFKAVFESAQAKWREVESFEADVVDKTDESVLLLTWQNYLSWAVEHACRKGTRANFLKAAAGETEVTFTPMEIICLFERAVTDLCLQASIWLRMADYLEAHVSADQQRLINTLARAVRNIPWSNELWRRYALACEARAWDPANAENSSSSNMDGASVDHSKSYLPGHFESARGKFLLPFNITTFALIIASQVYENALKCSYSTASDLLAVWSAYFDFLLRIICNSNDQHLKERCTKMLRNTFERAKSHISTAFPDHAEHICSIYHYWAFVEAKWLENKERSRELWKAMSKMSSNGKKPGFWTAYLEFVKSYDNADEVVRVAGMAANSVTGEFAESLIEAARRCLAESGVDFKRSREFSLKVAQRQVRTDIPEAVEDVEQEASVNTLPYRQRPNRPNALAEKVSKGRKRKVDENTPSLTAAAAKRQKVQADIEESAKKDVVDETEKASLPKHGETVIHDPSKDDQTVFVSNLPFSTNEEELQSIFAKCGELVSIRLVRDYAGKSKGFGYVEFADASSVAAALELDRLPIGSGTGDGGGGGRPMFVSVCDTNRSKPVFAYKTGVPEPNKLFVRNLDKVTTEEALRTFFGKYGEVRSVRIVTYRNGVPKGHAYVEFAREEEASRALVATDGVVFGSKAISVAISNPPPRSAVPSMRSSSASNQGAPRRKSAPLNPPL